VQEGTEGAAERASDPIVLIPTSTPRATSSDVAVQELDQRQKSSPPCNEDDKAAVGTLIVTKNPHQNDSEKYPGQTVLNFKPKYSLTSRDGFRRIWVKYGQKKLTGRAFP